MKLVLWPLLVLILSACANRPCEKHKSAHDPQTDSSPQIDGVSNYETLTRVFPLSGLVVRVLDSGEGWIRLDTGTLEGTRPNAAFSLFHRSEFIGVWTVTGANSEVAQCKPRGKSKRLPTPGDVAVSVEITLPVSHVNEASRKSFEAMPFGRHPFGPWDVASVTADPAEERSVVCFIGRLGEEDISGVREVETVWGNPAYARDFMIDLARPMIADAVRDSLVMPERLYAELVPFDDDEQRRFHAAPAGTRVVARTSAAIWFVSSDQTLARPGSRDALAWSSDRVNYDPTRGGGTDFAIAHSEDGIPHGRLEVWRDQLFVGFAEIGLSSVGMYCTLVEPAFLGARIKGGEIVGSRLWRPDRSVRVALHGSFEPPMQAFTKAQLAKVLTEIGCVIDENVVPGTDLVILGSNLLGDERYRKARNDLCFETIRESCVRHYFQRR